MRDVSGRSRIDMFNAVTLPNGERVTPVRGTAKRVTFRREDGSTFEAPNSRNGYVIQVCEADMIKEDMF